MAWFECIGGNGGGGSADHITLTQAEYDALVEAGTVDPDAFYFITDTNGQGDVFQPVIYSLEEREIGVWTDGKPLYEKTFNNITYGSRTTIDVSSLNIDTLVAFGGTNKEVLNDNQSTFGYYNSSSDRTQYYYNASNNTIIIAPTTSGHGSVTIRYTKTTDQAGSGTWTPQGVPAVHYSADEHVVGTWIDGSPIYEVTKSFSHNNSWDGQRASISHGISNIDTPIDFDCRFYNRSSKNLFNTVIRTSDDTYNTDDERIQGSLELNAQVFTQSDLIVAIGDAYILNGITIDLVVTFRYTKTST